MRRRVRLSGSAAISSNSISRPERSPPDGSPRVPCSCGAFAYRLWSARLTLLIAPGRVRNSVAATYQPSPDRRPGSISVLAGPVPAPIGLLPSQARGVPALELLTAHEHRRREAFAQLSLETRRREAVAEKAHPELAQAQIGVEELGLRRHEVRRSSRRRRCCRRCSSKSRRHLGCIELGNPVPTVDGKKSRQ